MKKALFCCLLFFGLQVFGMNHIQPQNAEVSSAPSTCSELREQVNIASEEERQVQDLKRSTLEEKRRKYKLYITVAVNELPVPENHPAYFPNLDAIIATMNQAAMEGLELPTLKQAGEDYVLVSLRYNEVLKKVQEVTENYRELSLNFQIDCAPTYETSP